jgi:hypothetical protein
MAEERIDLRKDVFSKAQYIKTIDTSFTELGVKSVSEQIQEETSVEEFFQLYQQLFYEIPAEGSTNSHQYLVEQSGEYINFEQQLEEIEALREEIARLRTEILDLQIKNVETETGQSLGINTESLKEQLGGLSPSLEANAASLAQAQSKFNEVNNPSSNNRNTTQNTSGTSY